MTRDSGPGLDVAWNDFVAEVVTEADAAWGNVRSLVAWEKRDGSQVTQLDLRLDSAIREALVRYFPEASVLSEETGLLRAAHGDSRQLAIVDPIDGTESLIAGRSSWWLSVGLWESGIAKAGVIYQPPTRRLHTSMRAEAQLTDHFVVGMSPDRLDAQATADFRERLTKMGASFVETPHAVDKIAAVLEGRVAAAVYLPSKKSPTWHAWDLAAGVPLAATNSICLCTMDGSPIVVDVEVTERSEAWICARDKSVWERIRDAVS